MSTCLRSKANAFLCVVSLVILSVFAVNAPAQEIETAYVPVKVNVAATVSIQCTDAVATETVAAGATETLVLDLYNNVSLVLPQNRANANVSFSYSRGNVFLELPSQQFRNADVSLFSLNGKQILRKQVSAQNGIISQANITQGIYLLTVKSKSSSFSTRLMHSGGGLNINTAFSGENLSSALMKAGDYGTCTITATAEGYDNYSIEFEPDIGDNPLQNIVLTAEGEGSSSSSLSSSPSLSSSRQSSSSRPPSSSSPTQLSSSRQSSSSLPSSSSSPPPQSSSSVPITPTGFEPEMLGLSPGATIAGLNLNWISTNTAATSGDKALVRILNAAGTSVIETFTGKAANATTGKRHHKVTVTGLEPNTSYKYSVSNNGTDWSNQYNYKTPPSGKVFTIAVIADPQITDGAQDSNTKPKADPSTVAQGWKETVEKIAKTDATFIVSAGDQVDDASNYKESQYQKFFAPAALRSLPLAPIVGNHDLHAQFHNHFNMPNMTDNPGSSYSSPVYSGGGNYYYLYNNILFVALNTGSYPNSLKDAQSYVAKYQKAMDAAKTAHAGAYDWLIVQHHKSTTSISSHASDLELEYYIDGGLEKLITDSGVDVVITGHDHIHVRSHLMKWDNTKGYSVKSTDGKGTIYLTLSTASAVKFYPALFILEPGTNEYVSEYTERFPVLSDGTRGWKEFGKVRGQIGSFSGTVNPDKIPLSVDFYVKGKNSYDFTPNYTPNYTIFEVNGKTIEATTYATTADNTVVDKFTLTPKGNR